MDEETGSELDFTSSEFDALQALTSPNVSVPIPEAPTFNNLGQLISTMARVKAKQAQGDTAGPSTGTRTTTSLNPLKRKFLPHQEPVMGRGRGRPLRNLLTRMDEVTRGPMSVLRNCMINKTRVKVWIRGATWIRGFCIGYIAAFDKQWNLAMTDVDETFTRRRCRKTPILGPVDHITDALQSLTTSDDAGQQLADSGSEHVKTAEGEEQEEEYDVKTEGAGEEQVEGIEEKEEEEAQQTAGAMRRSVTDDKKMTAPLPRRPVQPATDPLTGLVIQQVHRKHEMCQRHVQQLFIRGEQVALVAVLPV